MSAAEGGEEPWRRVRPDSPCVRVCQIHPAAGLCVGCLRTREEIALWPRLTPEERVAAMAGLEARRPLLARRRGGRAGKRGAEG